MSRSPSRLAQYTFDATHKLLYISFHSTFLVRLLARIANKLMAPIARGFGTNRIVSAHLYGRLLAVPAEHPLAGILVQFPQYNRPLGMAVEAIALADPSTSALAIIDVGANVGETIAIIEDRCPGLSSYLCVEADPDIAQLCALNHTGNDRVRVEQCYIGENEGAVVWLQDDGRANPSIKLAADNPGENTSGHSRLVRLDTVAGPFAEAKGLLSLIKIDTEGYDFSVLRSAPHLLNKYKPAIYFEWYPQLLIDIGEEVWGGFDYLATFGYRYFVFFTGRGDYYCKSTDPDRLFLRSLSGKALNDESVGYFDVFASTQEAVCNQLVEASIAMLNSWRQEKPRRRYDI
jgi:FkbM family methyltransferase